MNGNKGETKNGKNKTLSLYHNLRKSGRLQYILIILVFLLLIASAVFFIINVHQVVKETAISSYQTNELEIVRETARAIQEYVYVQTVVLGRTDISTIEQEVYTKFVDPIRLLKSGDAWIYAPDHIVFDQSADLPKEYWGRSMAEIFALQSKNGASHYEEMTADVTNAREGVGYYIWLPEKGAEIAAWTPVKVGNYTWTIGLSTPLPEILDAAGVSAQITLFTDIILVSIVLALILLCIWIFTDIRRRRAEQALHESEERYHAVLEQAVDAVFIHDDTGKILDVNRKACQNLGYSREELLSKSIRDIDPDAIQTEKHKLWGKVMAGEHFTFESHQKRKDGATIPVEVSLGSVYLPDRQVIIGTARDITERKQAEEVIRESEEKYRRLFEQAGDCILILEAEGENRGKILAANSAAAQMHGYSIEEMLTKNIADLDSPESRTAVPDRFRQIFNNQRLTGEATHIRKDGTEFPIDINAGLLTLGTKKYILAIDRDLSLRKQQEKALKIANQKLQLMNIVAWHDIQNKITGLRGYVELSQDMVDNEKVKKYLKTEEDILRVIDRQIQYTKEYQQIGVQASQWVNIPQTIKNVLMYKTLGPVKAVIDIADLEIYCDPIIERVFSHLIDNTLQHGQTATEIRINCHETADGLTLVYEDNGVGIPEHKKPNLFTQEVAKFSGFSMFFIHDLLEISDMTIKETGAPGKGARFEIAVPKGAYRFTGADRKN